MDGDETVVMVSPRGSMGVNWWQVGCDWSPQCGDGIHRNALYNVHTKTARYCINSCYTV